MENAGRRNIWLISKYASLPATGPGPRLFTLAREFRRAGHETVLITSDANHLAKYPETRERYNYEQVDGVRVCWIKTRKYRKTASVGRVLSWLDFERHLFGMPKRRLPRPDVVIVSSLSLFSIVYGYYLKRNYGASLVFEIRDIWPLTMVEEGGFSRWHPLVILLGMIERFGYRKADLVVGTMPRLDLHIRDTIGRDRPFHCSPLGFAEEWTVEEKPLSEEFLQTYFPKGRTIVGYAGSMGITNALDPLMECIERLAERPDIHFTLAGGGDLRDTYKARLSKLGNVSFAPKIARNEVQSFLRRCDVLYLSALDSPVWRFGQSLNKMVDYMMAGKPIIASYSGYESMLDEANAGVFVQAGSADALLAALIRMAEMPAEARVEMGHRGRTWLQANRSYRILAQRYLDALPAPAPAARGWYLRLGKRALDLVLCLPVFLLLSPLMLLLAGLVGLLLGRPVLFRQERPGIRGALFALYKFRTMTDRRDNHGNLLPDSERLTRFGRLLRSTSLDELPELWNVLRGDMSLVGPRPLLTQYLERYSPEQARRHDVKPGLTGWAQINGRNDLTWEEKFAHDVWYVDHLSCWLDVTIIASTLGKIITREGISSPGQATMPEFQGSGADKRPARCR